MQFTQVLDAYRRVSEVDKACEREYRLSDRAVVDLTIVAFDWAGAEPKAQLRSFQVTGDCMQRMDAGDHTPGELRALAEIRHMVDAWIAGGRELPPSNSALLARARSQSQ